ncbi:hypothetical protein DMB90_10025 [Raoultella planticola]|uniref:Uncharacterized protein n=1 Tax=Raoultella planticola TaxID=575 RepID=A0A5P6A9M6_RAOPL|nr:hypothetical protein DMB90_10025 [Raoultella planticola]
MDPTFSVSGVTFVALIANQRPGLPLAAMWVKETRMRSARQCYASWLRILNCMLRPAMGYSPAMGGPGAASRDRHYDIL